MSRHQPLALLPAGKPAAHAGIYLDAAWKIAREGMLRYVGT
jgi:hypothetical protein